MNLKSFDLEKALAGDPVITRDGRSVSEIAIFNSLNDKQNVFATIDGEFYRFTKNGKYSIYENVEYCLDLFMAPKIVKTSGWLNVYPNNKVGYYIHKTKIIADCNAEENRVACVFVEWEEEE
jgi:uncharacterized protein YjhX (UPF0386 family)